MKAKRVTVSVKKSETSYIYHNRSVYFKYAPRCINLGVLRVEDQCHDIKSLSDTLFRLHLTTSDFQFT